MLRDAFAACIVISRCSASHKFLFFMHRSGIWSSVRFICLYSKFRLNYGIMQRFICRNLRCQNKAAKHGQHKLHVVEASNQ